MIWKTTQYDNAKSYSLFGGLFCLDVWPRVWQLDMFRKVRIIIDCK